MYSPDLLGERSSDLRQAPSFGKMPVHAVSGGGEIVGTGAESVNKVKRCVSLPQETPASFMALGRHAKVFAALTLQMVEGIV